jgi:hypothetical protein
MPSLPPGWRIHEIAPSLEVRADRAAPPLAPALEAEIDRLWAAAQERMAGRLFNGRVFSADRITPTRVSGHWTEFRRIVAQMDRPQLFAALGVRPLAVNGVILGPDGLLFARRPPGAVYQPGLWQLPPAGSVDDGAARPDGTVDVLTALYAELGEELGLPREAVRDPRPLVIVEHGGSHVLDLGIALTTELTAAALRAAHRHADDEYAALDLVRPAELAGFLARADGALAPQVLVFLARIGMSTRVD